MADIAMLIAEEYERRVKLTRKMMGSTSTSTCDDHAKTMSLWAPIQWLRDHSLFHETHIQIKVLVEPKNQVGVAALDGFFSA